MNDLPKCIEEVDLAWLNRILRGDGPTRQIRDMRISEVMHGACTKIRIEVDADPARFPARLVMKAGFEPHSAAMAHMHANEMHAYRDFVPTIETNSPPFLTQLMQVHCPGVRVTDVAIEGAIHGTATKALMRLAYESGPAGPETIYVKGGWEDGSEILRQVGIFAREPRVYAELLARLAITAPIFATASSSGWQTAPVSSRNPAMRSSRSGSPKRGSIMAWRKSQSLRKARNDE